MSWKKEPCRNFQRGSCRYGDHCKFLHVNQQQQQPKANPFGFGSGSTNQPHQQKPNPFGFGVQNGSQSKDTFNPQNPFGNKWVRPNASSTPAQKPSTPPQHKCTDSASCKQLIVDDFNNEKPLWKLTCYAHFKDLPCDIVGDISYEELRFAAYEDAKRGLPLESIVQRERNLLSSKVSEFENLLRNPYVKAQPVNSAMNPFPTMTSVSSFSTGPNSVPPQAFSFGQHPPSSNLGPNISSPPSNIFGQSTSFQPSQKASNGFGAKDQTIGFLGEQFARKPSGVSPGGGFFDLKNNNSTVQHSLFSAFFGSLTAQSDLKTNQVPVVSTEEKVDDILKDNSIWLKATWEIKEIPEEEPPFRFC